MFTNLIRAKMSTHTVMVAISVLMFAANHFFSNPQADAWLASHWVLKDLGETVGAVLMVYGIYKQPTAPAA
jgi:hypothetical protein